MIHLRWARHACALFCALASAVAVASGEPSMAVVEFTPGMSVRQLAQDYLGNANLWPQILKTNNLQSVVAIEPGQKLRIPVSQVKAANRALRLAKDDIHRANIAGAQLFAPRMIATAISYRDKALIRRNDGAWSETFELARQSRDIAGQAYSVCQQHRDQAGQARISDKQGTVEGEKPSELVWAARAVGAILIEQEKIRTLSDSTAQITFRDSSRLRLNANSLTIIQRMRVDPLNQERETEVSLVRGNLYALLVNKSKRNDFDLEIPGVEATIQSGNFWVSHDDDSAKFANYDTAPVRIETSTETIVLGKNDGALVRSGNVPTKKVKVLPAPELLSPSSGQSAIAGQTRLRWAEIADAAGYWLEIGLDPSFQHLAASRWGLAKAHYAASELAPGIYYWRVSALDRFGIPGARSTIGKLEIRADTEPPYLLVKRPYAEVILSAAPVRVVGRSEPGAQLTIDGAVVKIDDEGHFDYALTPKKGANEIKIRVTDRAGNQNVKTRNFTYMPDHPAKIRFAVDLPRLAPSHFLARSDTFSLAGSTLAGAALAVVDGDDSVTVRGHANANGAFHLDVPLREPQEELSLRVVAPSGFTTTKQFTVTIDRVAPKIVLEEPLPRLTRDARLSVDGHLDEPARLRLNDRPIAMVEQRFSHHLQLSEGRNTIKLVAMDRAGNWRVRSWVVQLDSSPPELIDYRIAPASDGAAGLEIIASASDSSGLARIASYSVAIGERTASGFLRYDPSSKRYRAFLRGIDVKKAGQVVLESIELADNAGNGKVFSFSVAD